MLDENLPEELCLFSLENTIYGLDIALITEVSKYTDHLVSNVHNTEEYVLGISKLRGQIMTLLSLKNKLGQGNYIDRKECMVIVACYEDEYIGFLVDRSMGVIRTEPSKFSKPPKNLFKLDEKFFPYVYKNGEKFIPVLSLEPLLEL